MTAFYTILPEKKIIDFFAFNIKEKELLKTSHLSKSAKITVNQG